MNSRLIETVCVNYSDINDHFLTCLCCFNSFNYVDRIPKLLPCSHTLCVLCLRTLTRELAPEAREFSCPYCRRMIAIPTGGVQNFPVNCMLNQLSDLMAQQRKDNVVRCTVHTSNELQLCENCDEVFCLECTDGLGRHSEQIGALQHTVIPLSLAIKRVSEILLNRSQICLKHLSKAESLVKAEMSKLDSCVDSVVEAVQRSFDEVLKLLESRRQVLIEGVRQISDEKRNVLEEQLRLIADERKTVTDDCVGSEAGVDVRTIKRRITMLGERLDKIGHLSEPLENAYIRYDYSHNDSLSSIEDNMAEFGRILVTKTYPGLCTISYGGELCSNLRSSFLVKAFDYHGKPQTSGGDPLTASFKCAEGFETPVELADNGDGTYRLSVVPVYSGRHLLDVKILGRPIKGSPLELNVNPHINPLNSCSNFKQPTRVCILPLLSALDGDTTGDTAGARTAIGDSLHSAEDGSGEALCVLDSGLGQIKMFDAVTFRFLTFITADCLKAGSATGLCAHAQPQRASSRLSNGSVDSGRISFREDYSLLVTNCRRKSLTQLSVSGELKCQLSPACFVEPVDVCSCLEEVCVADNGAKKLFIVNLQAQQVTKSIGQPGETFGFFTHLSAVAFIADYSEIVTVGGDRVQVFSRDGEFLRAISPLLGAGAADTAGSSVGSANTKLSRRSVSTRSSCSFSNSSTQYYGVSYLPQDNRLFILKWSKGQGCVVDVHQVSAATNRCGKDCVDRQLFSIDSHEDRLKRPYGIAASANHGYLYVADRATMSVKQFRFK